MYDKIILFDAALLVQKNTMRAAYAEQSIKELWPLFSVYLNGFWFFVKIYPLVTF